MIEEIYNLLDSDRLITLASKPLMGKTQIVMNLVSRCIENNKRVLYFSFEESRDGIYNRLGGNEVDNVFVEDTPNINVATIADKIRSYAKQGIDLVIIDYYQLVNGSEDVDNTLNQLRDLAVECNTSILNVCMVASSKELLPTSIHEGFSKFSDKLVLYEFEDCIKPNIIYKIYD